MPRQPRLTFPGVAVHIIQRGNNRAACFRDDSDYLTYLAQLRDLAGRAGCAVHAYCLMTNHVHLLVTPRSDTSCTELMRDLGQRYVQYFNRRYTRTGTLWEGRFRSCLAESSRYVLACYRYIELNPVRAGMVSHPAEYLWSSCAANSGRRHDSLLVSHEEFLAIATELEARQSAYRALLQQDLEPSVLAAIRDSTNGGYPLVSDLFAKSTIVPLGHKLKRSRPGPAPKRVDETGRSSGSDPELFNGGAAS
jgi:putative transposase